MSQSLPICPPDDSHSVKEKLCEKSANTMMFVEGRNQTQFKDDTSYSNPYLSAADLFSILLSLTQIEATDEPRRF